MIWEEFIIDKRDSVYSAMEKINKNARGIVYAVDHGMLYGVITDGDVRRYLLRKEKLEESVDKLCNTEFCYLPEDSEAYASLEMSKRKISSIPIINDKKEIVKILFNDGLVVNKEKHELNVPIVIMAGGKGTRLYPYTQILPKPLIPIGEKTITEHIMDHFEEYGCSMFTMIVNYKKHFIKSYFEDNERRRNVDFIEEKEFWGTGGGLKLLEKKVDTTFFMTNCDILIEEDYFKILKYHREKKNLVTMVCAIKNITIPYGTVEVNKDGRATNLNEKPEVSFVTNTGLYVIEPEFIDYIPEDTFIHITDVIQLCINKGENVGVYKIAEDKWLDMGQLEELEKMKEKLNVK